MLVATAFFCAIVAAMTTPENLSPTFCAIAIEHARKIVPEFDAYNHLPTDYRLAIRGITQLYIDEAANETEAELRTTDAETLKSLLVANPKIRKFVISDRITKVLLPMCVLYTEKERQREAVHQREFNEISEPYVDLAGFIVTQARAVPPRLNVRTARGLLVSFFGLEIATGNVTAATAAAHQANHFIHERLVGVGVGTDQEGNQEPFPRELRQGVYCLEKLIGVKTMRARVGYGKELGAGKSFDQLVQIFAADYTNLEPKDAIRAAEERVSRVTGYVLDKIL